MNGSLSSGTGRLTPPKIEVRCTCGKRYRVSATKAGKRVRCKNCRLKITVPGDGKISMRSRKAILEEFGIDAEAAAEAYEKNKNTYSCTACGAKLQDAEMQKAYGEAGLTCPGCRAAKLAERTVSEEEEKRNKKQGKKELEAWTIGTTPAAAKRKAGAFGVLFFFGTAGFVANVLGLGAILSVVIAAVVAYAGARAIWNSEHVSGE